MSPRFDLIDIVRSLQRNIRSILIVAVLAGILGGIAYLVRKKKYKATSSFFVSNPSYMDRANLFRSNNSQIIDYFGSENDVDKVMAIANSDSMAKTVIAALSLDKAYHLSNDNPQGRNSLLNEFRDRINVKRTENATVEVSYTDPDATLAANASNEAVNAITEIFSGYQRNIRAKMELSVRSRFSELDSMIKTYTDTLAVLREKYGIYEILSPIRRNMVAGSIHATSTGTGRGIEEIQNIESIKDQMVIDRSELVSVINEFGATKTDKLPLIQPLSRADVPYNPSGPGLIVTVLLCAIIGIFFASLWILLSAYYRELIKANA